MDEKLLERIKSTAILVIVCGSFALYVWKNNDIAGAMAFASSVYAWWRNNGMTDAAIIGEKAIKAMKVTGNTDASQSFIATYGQSANANVLNATAGTVPATIPVQQMQNAIGNSTESASTSNADSVEDFRDFSSSYASSSSGENDVIRI